MEPSLLLGTLVKIGVGVYLASIVVLSFSGEEDFFVVALSALIIALITMTLMAAVAAIGLDIAAVIVVIGATSYLIHVLMTKVKSLL